VTVTATTPTSTV
jgi:hypothetical protein